MEKQCLICGNIIQKKPFHSMKDWVNKVKFCSRTCFHKYHKKIMIGHRRFNTSEGILKQKQSISEGYRTGKIKIWNKGIPNLELKERWKNLEFRAKMKNRMSGEHSPSWKGGGIQDAAGRVRAQKYIKDKCELCNLNKRLEVHHKDWNPKNNQIENLITLCSRCHYWNHKKLANKSLRRDELGRFSTVENSIVEFAFK